MSSIVAGNLKKSIGLKSIYHTEHFHLLSDEPVILHNHAVHYIQIIATHK